jgi:hypothetical protein
MRDEGWGMKPFPIPSPVGKEKQMKNEGLSLRLLIP